MRMASRDRDTHLDLRAREAHQQDKIDCNLLLPKTQVRVRSRSWSYRMKLRSSNRLSKISRRKAQGPWLGALITLMWSLGELFNQCSTFLTIRTSNDHFRLLEVTAKTQGKENRFTKCNSRLDDNCHSPTQVNLTQTIDSAWFSLTLRGRSSRRRGLPQLKEGVEVLVAISLRENNKRRSLQHQDLTHLTSQFKQGWKDS